MTFDGNVTLQNMITFGGSSNYAVSMLGGTNTFSNAVTFNNASITLGNNTSNVFSFNGGVTSSSNTTTTLASTVNSSGNPIDFTTVTVAANSNLNSTGGAISLGTTDSNTAGSNNLVLSAGAGAINFNRCNW